MFDHIINIEINIVCDGITKHYRGHTFTNSL